MDKKTLQGYRRKLIIEGIIKSGVLGLSAGLLVSFIIALVSYLTFFAHGFIIAFGALLVVSAVASFILYKKFFSVKNVKQVAARVDGMGMEERFITAAEYADTDSFIMHKLQLDTEERLKTITPKDMKFAFPKKIFIFLGITAVISIIMLSFSTARGVSALSRLDAPAGFRYVTNEKVTWSRVEGANSGYHILITGERGIAADKDVGATNVDVSGLEAGYYTITVFAKKSANRSQSVDSRPFKFKILTVDQKEWVEVLEELLADLRDAIGESDAEVSVKTQLYGAVDNLEGSITETDTAVDYAAKINAAAEEIRVILNGAAVTEIVFESDNGRNENVSLMRKPPEKNLNAQLQAIIDGALSDLEYPRTEETFKSSDIPKAPATSPENKAFMGWTVKGGDTILKDREILEAIVNGDYVFTASWLSEDEIIQRLLDELRAIINEAKIYEEQRTALHQVVDVLEADLSVLESLKDKKAAIGAAKTVILGMIESYKITVAFDPNNGVDAAKTIRKLPLEFEEKTIPKAPKNKPAEGMAFAGWAINNGAEEPEALDAAGVVQAILDGARDFIGVWFVPDSQVPDDSGQEENNDQSDTETDIGDIFDDTTDALDDLITDSDTSGSGVIPAENEYRGDEVIDGETPYTHVNGWYEHMAELLASGNLSPEMREIIERYFDTLKQ